MKFILICLLSLSAFSGFKMGTYHGVSDSGEKCQITFVIKNYRNAIKNPLNEEVWASLPGETEVYVLGHMPKISKDSTTIGFERDFLRGFKGTSKGAIALSVEMIHSSTYHGPKAFSLTKNNWKNKTGSIFNCSDLSL